MRKLYLLSTLFVLSILYGSTSFAQDFSNKGKDFYLCFPAHVPSSNNATLSIWITSDKASSGVVTMANLAFTQTFNIAANGLAEIQVPWTAAHISNAESNMVIKKSIRIRTDAGKPAVVAYAQQWAGARSAATLLLPVNVLGKKYHSINFTQNAGGRSQFDIIAVKDNTVVEITPRTNGTVGTKITINLPLAGDMYQYQSSNTAADLSGTFIESIASGTGGCLPIAVFSGSSNVSMGTSSCSGFGSSDPLFQQLYPISTWGKNFGFVPFANYPNGTPYRVMASEDATSIFFNGSLVATLNKGEIYPSAFTSQPATIFLPTSITADKPICVTQYAQSSGCNGIGGGNNQGDPDMVVLNPIEQNISDITIFSTRQQVINTQWINILMKTNATASFRISRNGGPLTTPTTAWQAFTSLPGYSYLREHLPVPAATSDSYRLVADSGFNTIAYGWGNNESYAYSAGTNVKDLYQQIGVSTEFGIETTPSVCAGSQFRFKISLPYRPLELRWNLTGLPASTIPAPSIITQLPTIDPTYVTEDSTTNVNGKTIYWFSIPTYYIVNTIGTYPVSIVAKTTGTDNCGDEQEIEFELEVSGPQGADFNWTNNNCFAQAVQFNDISVPSTKPTYKYVWDFGDPASGANNTSAAKNPTHTFSGPGTYTVKYYNITTPGCVSNLKTQDIIIAPLPTATITGTTTVCINTTAPLITFTAAGGTAPFVFTYTINGGAPQTVQTTGTNTSVTIAAPTNTVGPFIYALTSVGTVASAACTQPQTGSATVTVTANSTITLTSGAATSTQSVCQNQAIIPITYNIGGSPSATITGLPAGVTGVYAAGVVTISGAPTATAGVYNYTVTTVGGCTVETATGSITVKPDATLTLTSPVATIAQTVCANTAIDPIIYQIGGGATGMVSPALPAGVTAVIQLPAGIITISGTPTVPGTYTYTLTTSGTCAQASVTGTITVNALPTASFTFVPPSCEGKDITFNDASTPNAASITNWQWTFGDATNGTGSTVTHNYATAGVYNVSLVVTNSNNCVSVPSAPVPVTVSINPKAGFIVPEVCINDNAAVFTDTSKIAVGAITTWFWDFGDPGSGPLNTSTTKNGTHLYTATGLYTVKHIAYSSTGCSDTIVHDIFINGGTPASNFSVTNPAKLCSNKDVFITDLSTVNIGTVTKVEIYWDNVGTPAVFDVDNFPAGKVYQHKYPTLQVTRTYNIRLRAYSGTLCFNDKIISVTVNASPKIQFLNIPDICFDAPPYRITQATETGGVAGTPTFSGPGVTAGGIFTPSVAGAGTHTITYTFAATAGGCSETLTNTIHVYAPPVAAFAITSPACEKKSVSFDPATSVSTEGTLTKWTWDFGDASPVVISNSAAPVSHTYAAAGTYPVKLTVTTTNGCISVPKIIPVVISPEPVANFSMPPSICLPNANVLFSDLSTIADGSEATFSYLWTFGDAGSGPLNNSTAKNPSHTYTAVGPFSVNLQVTSGAGCTNAKTLQLTTIHPQPTAAFTTDKIDVCIGGDFLFTDNSNPADGSITQWNWTMDDGNVRNTPSFSYTYNAIGTYNVGLFIYNSYGCRSNTAVTTMSVNPYPAVNAGPDKIMLEGGQVTLTPSQSANGVPVTYLWSPPIGLNNPTAAFPIASPADDITYTLVVTSDKGCVGRPDQVFVKVLKAPAIPNIFSPNGDGIHDKWDIKYLETYPGASIDIFNRYGQLVFHSTGYPKPWDGTVNGKDVPVGTYYYVIDPKNGRPKMAGYVDIIR